MNRLATAGVCHSTIMRIHMSCDSAFESKPYKFIPDAHVSSRHLSRLTRGVQSLHNSDYLTTGFNMQYPFWNWYFYNLSSTSTGLNMVKLFFCNVFRPLHEDFLLDFLYPNFILVFFFTKVATPRSTDFPKSVHLRKPYSRYCVSLPCPL